uniref:UBC core domain-containing protein n=1 Tax=Neobodo designis TaxID=312471 RepID=A0A7S1Q484_NEODS|eukprot:CAMPEP_0174852300 /NCGR_PEP_ID=MMETSP1114-20130205/25292_1 /TAXON_ID=312471 /ORGANISM="Neobodo designis, Strain CCAP 1951/1" /LENGTH=356 /DNA_ID=CAMNT_0016086885 /DNA_START=28 /DNA_END=1098 /DNA_ORIENTATION=+
MATPVTKRLMREAQQMAKNPVREFVAYPLENNLLEWHFTMRGPENSPYAEGLYHGRVMVPNNYPFAPPDVVLITPNGRFELERKICLSISSYHPENWQSTWGIATVLTALRDFMLTPGNNGIGAVEYPAEVRQKLAAQSRTFLCPDCGQRVADHVEVMDAARPGTGADTAVPPTPTTATTPAEPPRGPGPEGAADKPEPQSEAAASPAVQAEVSQAASPSADSVGAKEPCHPSEDKGARVPARGEAAVEATETEDRPLADGGAGAVQEAAPDAPQEPRVAILRRGGGVEVQLSAAFVDSLLHVVALLFAFMLLKKLLLDAPRPETSAGALVRMLWSTLRAWTTVDSRAGPLSEEDL